MLCIYMYESTVHGDRKEKDERRLYYYCSSIVLKYKINKRNEIMNKMVMLYFRGILYIMCVYISAGKTSDGSRYKRNPREVWHKVFL